MNGSPQKPTVLMTRPDHFAVRYVINPWMAGHIGRTDPALATQQWTDLHDHVAQHAHVQLIDPAPDLPDFPFVANAALVIDDTAVLANFRVPQRQPETPLHRAYLETQNYNCVTLPDDQPFEGEGDALLLPGTNTLIAGYGVRSCLEAHKTLAEQLNLEVISLRLIDERFYHLDTCLFALPDQRVVYYPAAFGARSLRILEQRIPAHNRIALTSHDAMRFAANTLRLNNTLIMPHASEDLRAKLADWGYHTLVTPLDQFILAGGAAKCLTLHLTQSLAPDFTTRPAVESPIRSTTLSLAGHLLDTNLLNDAIDTAADVGGSARVQNFAAGLRRDQTSSAQLRVTAPDDETLDNVVSRLMTLGAAPADQPVDATLHAVTQPGVAPAAFYATTIYPTDIRIEDRWLRVDHQRMDAVIVVAPDNTAAACKLIRDLQPDDRVVTGHTGIRVHTPVATQTDDGFAFMTGSVSSERRVEGVIDQIAWEMQRIKDRAGKIAFVAGPVVIHTGGSPHLTRLIEHGYVQTLLTGNALPTHDIEHNLFGTSLGVDLQRGSAVPGGHQHHLRAINAVRAAGSIQNAVEQDIITGGIMHAAVKHDVQYVLAGSIRDDGPLPDTLMDLNEAQAAYAHAIQGADMIVMLASMLHAIGTGNMTPAGVRLICVDISPAVATKLADRGSVESTPVVTDVGLFLRLLADRLCH